MSCMRIHDLSYWCWKTLSETTTVVDVSVYRRRETSLALLHLCMLLPRMDFGCYGAFKTTRTAATTTTASGMERSTRSGF